MIQEYAFKIAARPPWTVRCVSRVGQPGHDQLIAAWWTGGWALLDDRLAMIEVDRAASAHAPGVWAWVITPLEYEGGA